MADRGRGWWRRWLHNATGDRDREAAVLAQSAASDRDVGATVGAGRLRDAAKEAVAIAHGDGNPDLKAASSSDIATPADVATAAAAKPVANPPEQPNHPTSE